MYILLPQPQVRYPDNRCDAFLPKYQRFLVCVTTNWLHLSHRSSVMMGGQGAYTHSLSGFSFLSVLVKLVTRMPFAEGSTTNRWTDLPVNFAPLLVRYPLSFKSLATCFLRWCSKYSS